MNNQKMKPVWRMNTGNGVPSDLGDELYRVEFGVSPLSPMARRNKHIWRIIGDDIDIAAYQTNRTKAAKFERVECGKCFGCGGFCFKKSDLTWIESCKTCQGTGTVRRKTNGN